MAGRRKGGEEIECAHVGRGGASYQQAGVSGAGCERVRGVLSAVVGGQVAVVRVR